MDRFMRKLVCAALMAAMLASLCACQASPEKAAVVSKNDGSFDKSVVVPATEVPDVGSTRTVSYTDTFQSTDNSVVFSYQIDDEFTVVNNPVVEVVPHYLTEEDAKRVATALLGDVDWYEDVIESAPEYTKEQIQEKINRWTQYASLDALSELYGDWRDPESVLDVVQGFIQDYSELYESAPSGSPKACEWAFQKDCLYSIPEDEITEKDLAEDNDAIRATAKVGGLEYSFSASTRNRSDFKLNNIHLYLGAGISPCGLDNYIYYAELCRTEAPTEENVAAAADKAQKMLDDMDLGQWQIDSTSVGTVYYGDTPEYMINITAVPVINGTPAARVPQFGNLKSEATYASNYYMSNAVFSFSPKGDLLYFEMFSPIDTKEVLNENAAVKSLDELMELAKEHLMLSDYYEYGLSAESLDKSKVYYGENLTCHVDICEMEYGMLRVKVPDTDESYYYVPGIVLSGTVDYLGSETGNVVVASGEGIYNSRIIPIVAINAVDGTNIELYIS